MNNSTVNNQIPIAIGFSVNVEINFAFDATSPESKIPLQASQAMLCGSAFDTAMALSQLGIKNIFLAGLVGKDPSPFKCLLENLVQDVADFPNKMIATLDFTSQAFLPLPINEAKDKRSPKVIGKRGQILSECLAETVVEIGQMKKSLQPKICLALGVQQCELPLAEELFAERDRHINILVLSAGAFSPESQLENVLKLTDFMFMSDYEYEKLLTKDRSLNFAGLHKLGVSLVVVTENCHGGQISFCKDGRILQSRYDSLKNSKFISEAGAGDWFLGGFIAKMVGEEVVRASTITMDNIQSWIKFASLVAGIKVGYAGASNGPTQADLAPYGF